MSEHWFVRFLGSPLAVIWWLCVFYVILSLVGVL